MIRPIQRADGAKYQVYGRADGKQVYLGTVDSKREATALEEDHRVKQRMRATGELAPEHDTERTLQDAAGAWLKWLDESHSRSHRAYSEFMRYQILPRLGTASIASIASKHVAHWRDDVVKDYAPSTVNSALGCLSSACSWFVKEQWLAANPCDGVKQREVPDRAYKWIRTRGELERLLLASSDELRDMIAVSVATMLRIDELLHLHHDDIDLETRLITVQRGRQGTTKSGKVRHVPILDSALEILRRRRLKRGATPLVFPGKGGGVRAQTPVTCAFKTALRRAQMDDTIVWHGLRHTGASWWVMSGGDIFRCRSSWATRT
jgi:integrase